MLPGSSNYTYIFVAGGPLPCMAHLSNHWIPVTLSRNMRFVTWLLCTLCALATTPPSTHTVHEKRDGPADLWTKQSRAQQDVILPIRVALKQQNLDNGERLLVDISDPDSPNFGR